MDKVMIITGGGRGIGAAVARRAAAAGYAVAVNYTAHSTAAERLVGEIEQAGGRAVALQADVAVEADVVRLYEQAEAQLGPPTAVVNNAGITAGNMPIADFDAANLARLAEVDEIAAPILWLLSDEASYVTGSCYEATGGGMVVGLPAEDR